QKRLRKEALFFYVTRGGVGISPFYSDIDEVRPATVMCFQDGRIESQTYLNWQDFLEIHPIDPAAAQQRFTEIASGYLSALVKDQGAVGCLLSGGTDSALIAWLLREIGANTLCLTADYSWEKYSEFSSAAATAAAVGLAHERVPITASNRRDSLYALNNARQNAPCSVGLSPILYQLAGAASKHGISILATGDHADSLFLGFERFFHSFPAEHEAYLKATAALTPAARIASLNSRTAPHPADEPLLAALGSSAGECLEWENALFEEDCARLSQWAGATPLHTLQQLTGQLWAGISFQNLFLPVTQALDHRIEFVSPFYDLEMIRFALSLPAEYKFRNGATKVLLRDLLARTLGRAVAKRASPNPARFWRLMPDLRERSLQGKALRPVYDRACFRNLVDMGASWNQVDKVGALGMWLTAQG
ncbi:MAG: asparagine synthase C-terminal domain-containing protein, partial [Terriglobia bacterium]